MTRLVLVVLALVFASAQGFAAPNSFGILDDNNRIVNPQHHFSPRGNVNADAPSVKGADKHKVVDPHLYPESPFKASSETKEDNNRFFKPQHPFSPRGNVNSVGADKHKVVDPNLYPESPFSSPAEPEETTRPEASFAPGPVEAGK